MVTPSPNSGADRRVLGTVLVMVVATTALYLVGALWLAQSFPLNPLGIRPFLVSDLLQGVVAACVLPVAWKLARR